MVTTTSRRTKGGRTTRTGTVSRSGKTSATNHRASSDVHDQGQDGICYAEATATAVRAAVKAQFGHSGPAHDVWVKYLVKRFGTHGADDEDVLEYICDEICGKDLRYEVISLKDALKLTRREKVVLAQFMLCPSQWKQFEGFFEQNKNEIISAAEFGKPSWIRRPTGHLVTIVKSADRDGKEYFKIKNSWGSGFADSGYFRVYAKAAEKIPFRFYVLKQKK